MTPLESIPIVTDDEISGEEKVRRVAKLVKDLRADLKELNYLPHERNAAMEQLKVFGRNPQNADPIFTKEGIEILTQHSFHTTSPTTSRAALQCLANALLGTASTRQIFVDLGYSPKAVARLKNPKKDDEMLMSRILFLTSYGTSQSFLELIDRYHLAEHINENISRHAKRYTKLTPKKPPDPHEDASLSETLKLLFNITHFCPQRSPCFYKSLPSIFKIITHLPANHSPPLKPPFNHLINALLNFPPCSSSVSGEAKKLLPRKSELKPAITRLLSALNTGLTHYAETDLEANLIPLLTLLRHLAPSSPPEILTLLRTSLVPPSPENPSSAPDKESLAVKVLRHLRAPISTQLHDATSALLFEVSGRDAGALVANFGIGFASGFLLSRNGQMACLDPGDAESVRDLNARVGSLSGRASARDSTASASGSPTKRSSTGTRSSQGSAGMLSPTLADARRGSAQSSRPVGKRRRGSSASGALNLPLHGERRGSAASTAASPRDSANGSSPSSAALKRPDSPTPTLNLPPPDASGYFSVAPNDSKADARSDHDRVPDGYDIILETRKAWKSGSMRAKQQISPGSTDAVAGAGAVGLGIGANRRQKPRPPQQELAKNREVVVVDDLLGPTSKRLSEMTLLMLDDHR